MDWINQCQLWADRKDYEKIIQSFKRLLDEEKTSEAVSMLAEAYLGLAENGETRLYERALDILMPLERFLGEDYRWNFRAGRALYGIDEAGLAYLCFQRALDARPGDEEAGRYLHLCEERLVCPIYGRSFRARSKEAWAAFQKEEAALRELIDRSEKEDVWETLNAICESIFDPVIRGVSYFPGKEEDRYGMILSAGGDLETLCKIVRFLADEPEELRGRWRFHAGQPAMRDVAGVMAGDRPIPAAGVRATWRKAAGQFSVSLYHPALADMEAPDQEEVGQVLVRQVLGEAAALRWVSKVKVLTAPPKGKRRWLSELPQALAEVGAALAVDTSSLLRARRPYRRQPIRDRDADWRLDVTEGETAFPDLVAGYYSAGDGAVDGFERDGAAAGFFAWRPPEQPERFPSAQAVREALAAYVAERAGADAVSFVGWADGLYAGYLDFIAWDTKAVLDAAEEFFRKEGFRQGYFHTFRRHVQTVFLVPQEAPEETPKPRAPILTAEEEETLRSYVDDKAGYFWQMLDELRRYIVQGISEGRFTFEEAQRDRDMALWYAYACNNIGTYEMYHRAARWMAASEQAAKGCGAWYYRYSVALMYTGRLEEARAYAERGAAEEPSYPWIWLQTAKLRAHFGDKAGALDAAAQGLFLEPGDHEFETLREEIRRGALLEEMEYHWIDPEADRALQAGLDEDADEKLRAIACITTDETALRAVRALFGGEERERADGYCVFPFRMEGHPVQLVFRMNRAGLSKLKIGWLRRLKADLDSGAWLIRHKRDREGMLEEVAVSLDYGVRLRYRPSEGDEDFETGPRKGMRKKAEKELRMVRSETFYLKTPRWDGPGITAALTAAGFVAEESGEDTIIAKKGYVTTVLCRYDHPSGEADAPAHSGYVTVSVLGGEEDPEARETCFTEASAAVMKHVDALASRFGEAGRVRSLP